jgi:hypothetical protein
MIIIFSERCSIIVNLHSQTDNNNKRKLDTLTLCHFARSRLNYRFHTLHLYTYYVSVDLNSDLSHKTSYPDISSRSSPFFYTKDTILLYSTTGTSYYFSSLERQMYFSTPLQPLSSNTQPHKNFMPVEILQAITSPRY